MIFFNLQRYEDAEFNNASLHFYVKYFNFIISIFIISYFLFLHIYVKIYVNIILRS